MSREEDIKSAIAGCEDEIFKLKYHLRWFKRSEKAFWLSSITSIVLFAVLHPLNLIKFQSVIESVGEISIIIGIICLIRIIGFYSTGIDIDDKIYKTSISEALKRLSIEKRTLARLIQQLKNLNEQETEVLSPRDQYEMYQLPKLIASYRKRADVYRRWFFITQVTIIVLSALVASLSGGWFEKIYSGQWVIPVLSLAITIITSLVLVFKPREKSTNLQQTADAMDLELTAHNLGILHYDIDNPDKASKALVTKIWHLHKEQQQRQQQLEQSSQAEQKALKSDQ
jgi:hypothetical protein